MNTVLVGNRGETLPQSLPYQGGRLGVFSEPLLDKGGAGVGFRWI